MDDNIKVQRAIVHQIEKERMSKEAKSVLSKELLDLDDKTNDLLQKLNDSYKNKKIIYAIFDEVENHSFPELYSNYYQDQTDLTFIDITSQAVVNLKNEIKTISQAKGGYLVFAQYEYLQHHFTAIYLIRNVVGMLFERAETGFYIDPTKHLDLDKLAMACRINNIKYSNNDGKYLSFINKKQSDISDYFIDWLAAVEKESNTTYTEDLFDLTNRIPLPKDENGNEIERDDFQNKIYDYAYTKPDKSIDLHELGEIFYNETNYCTAKAEEYGRTIDTNFRYDNRTLKKFVRIDINKEGIKLRFNRSKINDESIRTEGDSVIIDSAEIAEIIRAETER